MSTTLRYWLAWPRIWMSSLRWHVDPWLRERSRRERIAAGFVCDTCGEAATFGCVDMRRCDKPDDQWVSYEPIMRSKRRGCSRHPVQDSRTFMHDGVTLEVW